MTSTDKASPNAGLTGVLPAKVHYGSLAVGIFAGLVLGSVGHVRAFQLFGLLVFAWRVSTALYAFSIPVLPVSWRRTVLVIFCLVAVVVLILAGWLGLSLLTPKCVE